MTQTGWHCPNCDTANEPDARACAGCGRWPSLFDLESSSSRYRTDEEPSPMHEDHGVDAEVFTDGPGDVRLPDDEDEPETKGFRWGPVITFALVALFVLGSWLSDQLRG